jgi:hypothetical protein
MLPEASETYSASVESSIAETCAMGGMGVRSAVGSGYRFSVYKRTLPPAQLGGG